ncbi:hypothetical protein [Alkalisalibacterium limincola]|uniref:Uncharacterized protein n=1 Tax=Alkalisalibacterium limincola TaxID=2699169 RepID=A0A5C8KSD9_9GAMM|nr:hypothetical protein [Alkalisalibacterium limincola]TXK62614.1 hypothetical protein FU658_07670 [Alkalisalibacterium limincola]
MAWKARQWLRPRRILTGFALLAGLWLLTAFVGFVVFDRDTAALLVIGVSLVAFAVAVAALVLRSRVGWIDGAWAGVGILLLVALYSVPLRDDLPEDALAIVERIDRDSEDRYDFAEQLFHDLAGRFTGPTREYLLQPQRIFLHKSAAYFWETEGYVPSHLQTQLYRHMLIASGRFDEDEVVRRTGRCFNSPHGYLEIAHPERKVYADLWAAQTFEEYEFGQVVDMPSCDGLTADAGPEGDPL